MLKMSERAWAAPLRFSFDRIFMGTVEHNFMLNLRWFSKGAARTTPTNRLVSNILSYLQINVRTKNSLTNTSSRKYFYRWEVDVTRPADDWGTDIRDRRLDLRRFEKEVVIAHHNLDKISFPLVPLSDVECLF